MAEKEEQTSVTAPASEKKKPKWKKVVGIVLTVLLVVFLVGGILLIVQTKRTGAPFLFGYATYYVVSGSMEPTIMTNDVIIVKKADTSALQVGDVVTYRAKAGAFKNLAAGTPVTHRIVKIEGDTITTWGDNHNVAPIADKPISRDDVIGTYVKTSAFLTCFYKLFSSKYGFLFLVFIPLLILLGVQVFNFRRACKMDDDGKMPEEKSAEEVKEQAVKQKEEEIKRKAIEEYLAAKKRLEKAAKENVKKK